MPKTDPYETELLAAYDKGSLKSVAFAKVSAASHKQSRRVTLPGACGDGLFAYRRCQKRKRTPTAPDTPRVWPRTRSSIATA
jgi:hypothetical protein